MSVRRCLDVGVVAEGDRGRAVGGSTVCCGDEVFLVVVVVVVAVVVVGDAKSPSFAALRRAIARRDALAAGEV